MNLRLCSALIAVATGAYAQVSSINSAVTQTHVFNDVPSATPTVVNSYPKEVSLGESGVSAPTGFSNRDIWSFSKNGTNAYKFAHNDYFAASFNLMLTGNPATPRKEAGFLLSTATSGDIQFIVDTDAHDVVQFGGISFYSFNVNNGMNYNSGDKITLGMSYFPDGNGKNALQFFANGTPSPVFEFGPSVGSGANDVGDGSTLGGYLQVVNDPTNPSNGGTVTFDNIVISVPRPQLSINRAGGNIILSWPTYFTRFTLQSANNLASPVWVTSSVGPSVVNGQYTVTEPISSTQQFFRLSQ